MQGRLLVLSDVFPPMRGGSGRWLWELYRRLHGFDVTVLAGDAPEAADFDRGAPIEIHRLPSPRAPLSLLPPRGIRDHLRAMRRVRRLIAASRPDAIHCCRCLPEGLVALLARRGAALPVWCFAHGEELTLAETSRELTWLTKYVLRRVTHVIANSRHTRGLLVDRWGVPSDSITVMTPGVDTARFVPAPPDADWRRQMGWTGRRVILTIGALQKRKGQDMLIRALPSIRRQCPNVLYAVGGEGWEREYLERLATDTGVAEAVQFLGTPEETDLVKFYQQCDLFALPNRTVRWNFEGFGIVLLEAQSCAKAVVTGTSGGTVETIIPGETGLSVPCDAPEQLAAACVQLLEEPGRRARMGESGRAWVVQQFDWQALARQARELFSGVA